MDNTTLTTTLLQVLQHVALEAYAHVVGLLEI